MHKSLLSLSIIFFVSACVEAPSNGRKENLRPSPNPRQPGGCSTCIKPTGSLSSMMYRTKGTNQLTYDEVSNLAKKNSIPNTFHTIPDPAVVKESDITRTTKNYKSCGKEKTLKNVDARINACRNLNQPTSPNESNPAYWGARENGISGETDWALVYYDRESGHEMWMNSRTNLIWSHSIGTYDWNQASGYESANGESACKILEELTGEDILWRLPNRNEFLLADISGARYVLDELEDDRVYWTATSVTSEMKTTIRQGTGFVGSADKDQLFSVRCIGVVAK